jgi:WD40 repeat protein
VFYSQVGPEGDLYVARSDGSGGVRQLTDDAAIDRVPRWSPDGQWIATFSDRSGQLQVWKIRADGSDLRQLTRSPSSVAAWSPDGTRIAGQNGFTTLGISVYSIATRKFERVLEHGEWPVWLPDSQRILFVARGREFHILDTRTKTTKQIFSVVRDTLGPPRLTGMAGPPSSRGA